MPFLALKIVNFLSKLKFFSTFRIDICSLCIDDFNQKIIISLNVLNIFQKQIQRIAGNLIHFSLVYFLYLKIVSRKSCQNLNLKKFTDQIFSLIMLFFISRLCASAINVWIVPSVFSTRKNPYSSIPRIYTLSFHVST